MIEKFLKKFREPKQPESRWQQMNRLIKPLALDQSNCELFEKILMSREVINPPPEWDRLWQSFKVPYN